MLAKQKAPIASQNGDISVENAAVAPTTTALTLSRTPAGEILAPGQAATRSAGEFQSLTLNETELPAPRSANTARSYAKARLDIFQHMKKTGETLSKDMVRRYVQELRAKGVQAGTINNRLAGIRQMVSAARDQGRLPDHTADQILGGIKNERDEGTRTGNWLSLEQAQELLSVPDRRQLKGKRDHTILALLLGCALRRAELAALSISDIQMRAGRWAIVNLLGKGKKFRTIPIPEWVKQSIDDWTAAAGITEGRLMRALSTNGKRVTGEELSDSSIWLIVKAMAGAIGVFNFAPHDLRRTCTSLCRKAGGTLEQIQHLLGHASVVTTERYLGTIPEIEDAVNDHLGLH